MLEARDLECTRGERVLFSALALRVEPGTLLRVAGPNGTGKTSLLRMLCGLLQPTQGEVRWREKPIRLLKEEYWAALAYVGHLNGVKDDLTAAENLRASAGIAGLDADEGTVRGALDAVGLAGFEDSLARFLSQGQKRRIALARLHLSGAVPLWILDEPFTALDARGVAELSALVARQLAGGGIVVLTTHQEVPVAAVRAATVELGREREPRS
ncbi:MAG: cytochrome c biogenesis heme-transporting ATPase CcmA [Burkholderiales bacterium]